MKDILALGGMVASASEVPWYAVFELKPSLCCCASFGCRVFDASVFRADLKEVMRAAGIEGTQVLLFPEERHLGADPGEVCMLMRLQL